MLLDSDQPKKKKMAYSVENLAKSSRSESENGLQTPDIHKQLYQNVNIPYPSLQENFSPCGRLMLSPVTASSPGGSSTQGGDDSFCNLMNTPASEERNLKRKRFDSEETVPSGRMSAGSLESVSPYASDSEGNNSGDASRRKKARTAFSTEQVNELESRYQTQKYLPASERSKLAEQLQLSDQQVKTWFQNRRMKEKRQQRDEEQARSFSLPTGGVDISQLAALGIPCPPQPMRSLNQIQNAKGNQATVPQGQFPGYFDPRLQLPTSFPVGFPPMFPGYHMYPTVPSMMPQMTLSPMGRQAK